MPNILSQDEVDALLNAVESGDLAATEEEEESIESRSVVEYNFRRPNLLTKDNLRGFNTLHENFARMFNPCCLCIYGLTLILN